MEFEKNNNTKIEVPIQFLDQFTKFNFITEELLDVFKNKPKNEWSDLIKFHRNKGDLEEWVLEMLNSRGIKEDVFLDYAYLEWLIMEEA